MEGSHYGWRELRWGAEEIGDEEGVCACGYRRLASRKVDGQRSGIRTCNAVMQKKRYTG